MGLSLSMWDLFSSWDLMMWRSFLIFIGDMSVCVSCCGATPDWKKAIFYLALWCYAQCCSYAWKAQASCVLISHSRWWAYGRIFHKGVRLAEAEVYLFMLPDITIWCWSYGRGVRIIGGALSCFILHMLNFYPDDMIATMHNCVGGFSGCSDNIIVFERKGVMPSLTVMW